jgi:hypothetical protein
MCGIFAVEKSLKHHEHEDRDDHPSADNLKTLMSSKEDKDQVKHFAQFGQAKPISPRVVMSFDQEGADFKIVWIWKNNAQDESSGTLGRWSRMGLQKWKRGVESSPGEEGG